MSEAKKTSDKTQSLVLCLVLLFRDQKATQSRHGLPNSDGEGLDWSTAAQAGRGGFSWVLGRIRCKTLPYGYCDPM